MLREEKTMKKFTLAIMTLLLSVFILTPSVAGQPYYKNKTIKIVLPVGSGGAFSAYTLLLIPYIKKHIPGNPTVIMENRPGGGGFRAANYLYNVAPKDGTSIGMLLSGTTMAARLNTKGVRFDPTKFDYLGGGATIRGTITIRRDTGVTSLKDAKKTQVILGSSRPSSMTFYIPKAVNHYFGTRFKIVKGYKGMGPIDHAVERNEVQGRVTAWEGTKSTRRHWLTTNYVVHLATVGLTREPDLPKIPTIVELAPSTEAKQVLSFLSGNGTLGRMFLAPPGTNPEALKILRKALIKALNDPKYKEQASLRHITVSPIDWRVLLRDVKRVMGTNQLTVDLTKKVLEK